MYVWDSPLDLTHFRKSGLLGAGDGIATRSASLSRIPARGGGRRSSSSSSGSVLDMRPSAGKKNQRGLTGPLEKCTASASGYRQTYQTSCSEKHVGLSGLHMHCRITSGREWDH